MTCSTGGSRRSRSRLALFLRSLVFAPLGDLGHTPETFVKAAHCQITGAPASAATVAHWTTRMRDEYYVRRIDVVRALCAEAKRDCKKLAYSDPWAAQPELPAMAQLFERA